MEIQAAPVGNSFLIRENVVPSICWALEKKKKKEKEKELLAL